MKKLLVLLILLFAAVNSFASVKQDIELKPGTKMIYSVFRNGNYSNLILTINTIFPNLSFSYQTTFDPATKGDVTITRDAFLNADHMVYYLLGGDMYIDNGTTLWFSQKSFIELKNSGSTQITSEDGSLIKINKLNNSVKKLFINNDTVYVNYMNAAQVLSGNSAEIEYGDTFQILDDPKNPMILKMDVGWTVELKKIIYPEESKDR